MSEENGRAPVPMHLRNAPTKLMKELGHGHAYRYAHDEPQAYAAGENYFPDGLKARFYRPSDRGLEGKISEKLAFLRELDKQQRSEEHTSELQSLMRISYAVFCLKKKKYKQN